MALWGFAISYLCFAAVHLVQFALATTVIALYGQDVNNAALHGADADGRWVYAVVVGCIAAMTSLLLMIPFVMRYWFIFMIHFFVASLWIIVFGMFSALYLNVDTHGDVDMQQMKNAVWVDLANLALWVLTTAASLGYYITHRERWSRFTGRASV